MTFDGIAVLLVVAASVILFVTEVIAVDLVALLAMSSLVLSGVLTAREGLAGFSDGATVAVAGMLVMSTGLASTGAVSQLPRVLAPIFRRNFTLGLGCMTALVCFISGAINNTACVAIFLPVCLGISRMTRVSPSKLLMPLSFAAIFGGTCTLIGTSPNLIVSSIAQNHGLEPFGMFEFSQLGLLLLVAGTIYMLTLGIKLLPERRRAEEMTKHFGVTKYLAEVTLLEGPLVGKPLSKSYLVTEFELEVVSLSRDGEVKSVPSPSTILKTGDVLLVSCVVETLRELQQRKYLRLHSDFKVHDCDLQRSGALLEVLIPARSVLVGESLESIDFRARFGGSVIALRHSGDDEVIHHQIATTRLEPGDVLLVEVRRDRLEGFKAMSDMLIVISESRFDTPRRAKMIIASLVFSIVVGLAALDLLPIEVGSVAGGVIMVLSGCLTREQAYQALEWKVIALIAGSLSLGVAMEKSGVAAYLGSGIVAALGSYGPVVLLSGTYLATMLLTEMIPNAATAALMAPLAIATAVSVGFDTRPFLVAVTFACSASFMTPIGYQTNMMVYGPGKYRFNDFLRVGIPLNLLFWLLASLLIPLFFPFNPVS